MSLMTLFVLSFSTRDVLDEIWEIIKSVSEGFLSTLSYMSSLCKLADPYFFLFCWMGTCRISPIFNFNISLWEGCLKKYMSKGFDICRALYGWGVDSHDYLWDWIYWFSNISCPLLTDNFREFITSGTSQAFKKYFFLWDMLSSGASIWLGHSALQTFSSYYYYYFFNPANVFSCQPLWQQ